MIKDFSKDEYDEFISLFSVSNAWHLIKSMLSEVDSSFLNEGENIAFLALRLAEKQKIDMKSTRHLVFAALFHDIGSIWKTSTDKEQANSFDFSNSYDRALSSYLFLKYFSPLKDYSDIVLFQHGRADRPQKNNYYGFGVKLNLVEHVASWHHMGKSKEEIVALLNGGSGTYFFKKDVEDMVDILNNSNVLANLETDICHQAIDEFLSSLYFRRDVVRNYLFMVTYCFEFYNAETMFHARMTASLCYLLGRYLNLDLHALCVIYTAGLFGDIGKVHIPHEILEKPGKLTPEETVIMQKHIIETKRILEGCFKDKEVIDIAFAHHERIDGSGYPQGLKGDQMNVGMKICQVADIGAALMGQRTYKDAYPMDRTIEELVKMRDDGKLDKDIVNLFKDNQNEIFAYLQNHLNRMLRFMQALREERQRLKFADTWEK